MNPKYPIYIVSKGRSDLGASTWHTLDKMKVKYFVIVDKDQFDLYTREINLNYGTVIEMPNKYTTEYDMFWKDNIKVTGPGAARNFAWDHSIRLGFKKHWVMDDNIEGFYRLNRNDRLRCRSASALRVMEDFTDRYTNVAISGPQYAMFAICRKRPYDTNTRIYSCLLIRNDIPYRWRGRYNEDTDLSLRALKDNWCTIQFNAFLQIKRGTQQKKGGNTEQFYSKEGTLNKSQMLKDMHPDVTRLVLRYGRAHHYVDYSRFNTKLKLKDNINIPEGINEYGMKLVEVKRSDAFN